MAEIMRGRHHLQLAIKDVEKKVLKLSSRIDETLLSGMTVLMTKDINLSKEIIEKDKDIDILQKELDDVCAQVIAMEQPVATDLRYFIGCIKLAASLERIGDYIRHMCINIENVMQYNLYYLLDKYGPFIQEMIEICSRMLKSSIDAFITQDKDLAIETAKLDKNIDSIHFTLYKEVVSNKGLKHKDIEAVLSFLDIIRFVERTGDLIVNINEHIVYVVTGEHVDLN